MIPAGGEAATILWLPWKQGETTNIQASSIAGAAAGTLFLTYTLTGCKVFALQGGPVWHIDALVEVAEFWPSITSDDWVDEHWVPGSSQNATCLHRAGQAPKFWDLAAYVTGGAPATYGAGNVGNAFVGGIVNRQHQLDLYYQASPWKKLTYSKLKRTK